MDGYPRLVPVKSELHLRKSTLCDTGSCKRYYKSAWSPSLPYLYRIRAFSLVFFLVFCIWFLLKFSSFYFTPNNSLCLSVIIRFLGGNWLKKITKWFSTTPGWDFIIHVTCADRVKYSPTVWICTISNINIKECGFKTTCYNRGVVNLQKCERNNI